jgi:putative phosphoesterase
MLLGLISDTHGFFDPALPALFAGVEEILHAGDIGKGAVLERLGALAPVSAIRGNIDEKLPTRALPVELALERQGAKIFITHDAGKPGHRPAPLAAAIERFRPGIILSGHSHRASILRADGRIFVNPGSAGKKRFNLKRTAGLLHLSADLVRVEIYSLEGPAPSRYLAGDFPLA